MNPYEWAEENFLFEKREYQQTTKVSDVLALVRNAVFAFSNPV
jgi:hypothetical protein